MNERPKYRMRFVGYDSNGELKPTAPAFKKNEIRELPLEYAQYMWWELIDALPDLVIPEAKYEDSVFVEETFVPAEDKLVLPVEVKPEDVDVILYEEMTVESLRLFIKGRGGEVESRWRKPRLIEEAQKLEEARRAKIEESLKEASESSTAEPEKTLVEKQNELAKRYHDGEITSDAYRELSDKLNKEASEPES